MHIFAGTLALLCGLGAIMWRNKIKTHRPFGKIYFWSMSFIFVSSVTLSVYRNNIFLFCVGFFTYYFCITAYRALRLKKIHLGQEIPKFDWALEVLFGLMHIGFVVFAVLLLLSKKTEYGVICLVFGLLGINGNYTTIKRLRRKVVYKNYWLLAHIGGMLGSYIGALTAFLVNNYKLVPLPPIALWLGPTVLIVPLIVYEISKQKARSTKIAGN